MLPKTEVVGVRKAIEAMYDGRCTITKFQEQEGLINNTVAIVVAENIPCRLSYKNFPNGKQTDTATALTQVTKLFLSPKVAIKAGSEITVTQNGVTKTYKAAGAPVVYASHQEVELTLKDVWA